MKDQSKYGTKFTIPGVAGLDTPDVKMPIRNGIGMGQRDGGGSNKEPKTPSRSSK